MLLMLLMALRYKLKNTNSKDLWILSNIIYKSKRKYNLLFTPEGYIAYNPGSLFLSEVLVNPH